MAIIEITETQAETMVRAIQALIDAEMVVEDESILQEDLVRKIAAVHVVESKLLTPVPPVDPHLEEDEYVPPEMGVS